MLGMFSLLPLLKGWGYKIHVVENAAVVRGAEPMSIVQVDRILENERGWLLDIGLLTDDVYGTLIVKYRGADLDERWFNLHPEALRPVGAWAQDPAGWIQRYDRPNPNSTAGIYVVVQSSGYHGAPSPYVPPVRVELYLPSDSTQGTAYICGMAGVIAITDENLFQESLEQVLYGGLKREIRELAEAIKRLRR